jgi:hypothetical protein
MNHRSWECCWWGRVWSIWWDSSFRHLNDQAKNNIDQRSSLLAQRPQKKVKNSKKPTPQWKVAQWLCKICSMCENNVSCVNCDSYWIFVWNMLNVWKYSHLCEKWLSLDICVNVWKYGHLCGNFTFIGYFCEICSIFPKVLCLVSGEVCAFWQSKRETRL